jgi:hypothetical protein
MAGKHSPTQFFLFSLSVGLGFELRVSCLQIRSPTTWIRAPVHFAPVILEMEVGGSHKLFAGLVSNREPLDLCLPSSFNYSYGHWCLIYLAGYANTKAVLLSFCTCPGRQDAVTSCPSPLELYGRVQRQKPCISAQLVAYIRVTIYRINSV